ncbi:hypothetical protein D3Z51_11065 [Clostridiaceae bacterium]|nr:hypothetical protein [Clostridiaceae bacterium]RKI13559.1 hypothetical protein D7V81_09945 [bacterium 1XD21-70]
METKLKKGVVFRNSDNWFNTKISIIQEHMKIICLSTFLWGILAHGFMLFNKISYHDDIAVFFGPSGIKSLTNQGRWMWGVFACILKKIYAYDYSISLYKGFFTFVFVAITFTLIAGILEYKYAVSLFVLSGILVVNTTITCLFGYIYMSLIYTFALMLSVIAAVIICKSSKWYLWCIALVLNVCAIGTYQLFFCSGICIILIHIIQKTLDEDISWKKWWIRAIKYIVFYGMSVLLYVVLTKLFVHIYDVELIDYAGISSMGIVSIKKYIKRILLAYAAFFMPRKYAGNGDPYPLFSIWGYRISVIVLLVFFIYLIRKQWKIGDKRKGIQLAFLFVLFPLTVNFIYVLAGYSYEMTFYCHVFIYIMLIFLAERLSIKRIGRIIFYSCISLVFLLNIFFCRYDNACYLKAEILMENAKSYFTTLVTRIQSTEGYSAEYPVAYIEPRRKYVMNDGVPEEFQCIQTNPYNKTSIINDYMWSRFMYLWCGYQAKELPGKDYGSYMEMDEVKRMPSYPADGSIKVIGQVVVVKFADPEQ